MKTKLVAVAALCMAGSAVAADVSLLVYGGAYHFDGHMKHETRYNLNEVNPGIGLEVARDGWLVGAGTYEDSFRKQARMAYGGYRWGFGDPKGWNSSITLKAGYLHGSGYNGLVALPTVGVGYGAASIEMTAFPSKVRNGGVLAFWLRYQF